MSTSFILFKIEKHTKFKKKIIEIFLQMYYRPIRSVRPRFPRKCDRHSRDLTQLPSGYNFAVKPATNQRVGCTLDRMWSRNILWKSLHQLGHTTLSIISSTIQLELIST